MAASSSDVFTKVGAPGTATTLSAPGHLIGGTALTVVSTSNWPTTTGAIFAMDTVTIVDGAEVRDVGSYTEWEGVVASGTSITGLVLRLGTDQDYPAGVTTRVYIPVAASQNDRMVDGLALEHSQLDGTHSAALITSRTADTAPASGDSILTYDTSATSLKKVTLANLWANPAYTVSTPPVTSWISSLLPSVSSVTNNGNRSYDITFASTVASYLTPGMRIRTSRTVAAPTYMGGAFNGTNHYFTKVTCTSTLSTVTNNFTFMTHYMPTAYAVSQIGGRSDAASNNAMSLSMEADGRVSVSVFNGGVANYRQVSTYQSLPLNKKTHIAASWTGGTVVIYFDGVSVPVATATTGGTAPTTAGTGGDFSIGRKGAYNANYTAGYISGFGVFDAVLTASTIKSYIGQVLSGSETNCIGAWSLNNTAVNQQAAGTNDLTATNSVGYTSGTSPYCTDATGVATGTYDYAIVTKVATTVATVQVPEGCAIPTSGGVSAVDLSSVKSPFGMTVDAGRWNIRVPIRAAYATTSNATYGSFQSGGIKITVPVGAFTTGYMFAAFGTVTTYFNLSPTDITGSAAGTNLEWQSIVSPLASNYDHIAIENDLSLTTATGYTMYSLGATTGSNIRGNDAKAELYAKFNLL
jgi:hypothetical protein